jgi:hypothetical protein
MINQESKSPQQNGSSQDTSPQPPTELLPVPAQDEFPLVSHLAQGLEDCNWEQLQTKYSYSMEEHGRAEENLRVETAKLLEVKYLTIIRPAVYRLNRGTDFHDLVSYHCVAR